MADRIFKGECGFEGCARPVEASGMCAAHRGRKKRKRTVSGRIRKYGRTPFESISEAALDYAAVAAEDVIGEASGRQFELAQKRFRTALDSYYRRAKAGRHKPGRRSR